MGDQNRRTFRYRIRRSGHNQSDPNRVKRLADAEKERLRAGVLYNVVDESLHASAADIDHYRQFMRR